MSLEAQITTLINNVTQLTNRVATQADSWNQQVQQARIEIESLKNNIPSAMSRAVYVNQTTGNDNFPGTMSNPFKSLKKAIDSIPAGGIGVVYLIDNYEMTFNSDGAEITVQGKRIILKALNDLTLTVKYGQIPNNNTYGYPHINLINGFLDIWEDIKQLKIIIEPPRENTTIHSWSRSFIYVHDGHFGQVRIQLLNANSEIIVNSGYALIGSGYRSSANGSLIHIGLINSPKISLFNNSKLVALNNANLVIGGGFSRITHNNSPVNPSDVITGIVRDTSNRPLNIISTLTI